MPENHLFSFDHEATLEELAGVGKNRRFDEVIDDEENEEIHVICKSGLILLSSASGLRK